MNVRWTRTNVALDEFFELLACQKCKQTPTTPFRSINCGHILCETCCAENASVCTMCKSPIGPNELERFYLFEELIKHCQTIRETIRDINIEDKQTNVTTAGTKVDAKEAEKCVSSINDETIERDSESDTPGYRDRTQNSLCLEENEADEGTPGYRDPTQISERLKENEVKSETPGYRDPTQLNESFEGNEAESETPGYRECTQISIRKKKNDMIERSSKSLASDPKTLENHAVRAINMAEQHCDVDSDILVPESIPMEEILVGIDDAGNTTIPESMETVEENLDHDTVSIGNLVQVRAQEFDETNQQAPQSRKTLRSGNSCKATNTVTRNFKLDRHKFDDTTRRKSQKNLNEFSRGSEQTKVVEASKTTVKDNLTTDDATNRKIIVTETSETADDRVMVKIQQLRNVENLHQRNLLKRTTKTIVQSKRPKMIPKNVNKRNGKGESKLHAACVKGQDDYVKALLEAGANPNTKDHAGWTPLQEAAALGNRREICKMLLESGALPNTLGIDKKTALHDATIKDNLEEAALLLRFNADIDAYDRFGKRPIDYAVSDEMRKLLTDSSNVERLAVDEAQCLNNSFDRSIVAPKAKVVVLPSNLSSENKKLLMQVSLKLKIAVVTTFRPGVTHLVVEANERNITELTYNVMLAILEGKWIVNSQWIAISTDWNDISENELEIFQVHGVPSPGTPERSRMNEEKQNPRLFNNCFFYFAIGLKVSWFYGELELTKQNLTNLVLAGQGEILVREPDPEFVKDNWRKPFHVAHKPIHPLHRCSHYIIYMPGKNEPRIKYNMLHIKTLPLAWFFECIEKFTLVDPILMGIS